MATTYFPYFLFTDLWRSGMAATVDGFVAIKIAVLVTFIHELSDHDFNLNRAFLNPAQFFILSFLSVVLIGALLLMMHNATTQP